MVHNLGLAHHFDFGQVGHEQYAQTTAACAEALVTVRWLGFHRIWQGSGEAFSLTLLPRTGVATPNRTGQDSTTR